MKLQKLVRLAAALLNVTLILISLLVLFTGHASMSIVVGGSGFLNCFILFKAPEKLHSRSIRAIRILSVLGNLCLAFIGTGLLHINKGPSSLWGGYWLILTAILGFYFAIRQWRLVFPKKDKRVDRKQEQKTTLFEKQHVYQNITTKKPKAELRLDKRRLIFIVVAILAACIAVAYGFYELILKDHKSLENPGSHLAFLLGFGLIFCGMNFVRKSIGLIRNPPLIRLFENGMEIVNLGFWEWGEINGAPTKSTLVLILKRGNRTLPLTAKKTGATFYKYDPEKDFVIIKFEFPICCSHTSLEEFGRAVIAYAPPLEQPQKTDATEVKEQPKSWKTYLFNSENPTTKTVIINLSLFLLLALCFYTMAEPNFFPSTSWDHIGNILILISVILTALFSMYLLWSKGTTPYLKNGKKIRPLLTALILPPTVWLLFKIAIVLGFGHTYTELYGSETSMVVPVEKTNRTHRSYGRYSHSPTLYCLNSEKLQRGFMNDLCIKKDRYESMPGQFFMTLVGKQSYFGFVVDRYFPNDPRIASTDEGDGSVHSQAEYALGLRYAAGKNMPKDHAESARHLRIAAEEGNARAQFLLGVMYTSGEGVEKNVQEAADWFEKAAHQGNKDAQRQLGQMYMSGVGVDKDAVLAEKWMRAAAEQGDPKAQFFMGALLVKKEPRNPQEIQGWFKKSAEQGTTEAQTALGMLYLIEDPSKARDPVEAAKWLRQAADKGDAKAQEALALLYLKGDGIAKDPVEAAKMFLKAAEQDREKPQLMVGLLYASGQGVQKDLTEAEKWFRKAAEKGNAEAQYLLGRLYYQGDGVVQDYAEAVKWWRLSAGQGYSKAQNDLGDSYEKGNGVTQDFAEALNLYQKAAGQGLPIAYNGIGDIYRLGEGVTQDYTEAERWYRKAAENGFPEAQFRLGQFYADGTGITQSHANAYFWLTLAASAGFKDAPPIRDSVASHLTERQVSDIQKRANDWKPIKPQTSAPSESEIP